MPPNRSRRLPGGRVRRPRPDRPTPPGDAAADRDDTQPRSAVDIESIDNPASLGGYHVGPATPAPAAPVTDIPAERGGIESSETTSTSMTSRQRLRERAARRGLAQRTGPSSMDLVAQHYQHVRADLLKILILSAVMFGIIVVLALVLR